MVDYINGQSTAGMSPEQYVYNVNNPDSAFSASDALKNTGNDYYELQWSSAEAQKDRDWQEYMSSTAYQRAFDDIKAAGYNPWLILDRGSAASTPGGSTASASSGYYSAKQQRKSSQEQNAAKYVGMFVAAAAMLIAGAL